MRQRSHRVLTRNVVLAPLVALGTALVPLAAQAQALPSTNSQDEEDEDIVVTATLSGHGVPANQLGASVTVLGAEVIEQRQTRIVSDVLRDVPGVAVNRAGGVGGQTQIRLRGTEGNHVLVLIDGIEAADPFNGEFDFAALIADPAARIEVLRGQQSSLYGSDAIGGVVHYMTLTGAEAPGGGIQLEAGSFGTLTTSARAAGVNGDLDYSVSGAYFQTGGTPTARQGTRDVGADIASISGKLIWSPSESFRLTGVGRYNYTEAEANDSETNAGSPLFGTTVDSPGVYGENEAIYALLRAELLALDGRWTNSVTGQIADATRASHDRSGRNGGSEGQRLKGSFVSSLSLGSAAMVHRITGALDVERESFRNTAPGDFAFTGERHTDNVGLVGQYELVWDEALSLGASIRHDDNNRFGDVTTYRVQGSYGLPFGTRVRGAWGTGVKNPGYLDLYGYFDGRYIGNPDLRPETSEGWEAGIEQSIGGIATIGATYFDSTLEDEIYTTYPAPDFIATPANRTTKSQQEGVELFLSARPTHLIRLDATYTWLKAEENGVEEVRRPEHIASFNATAISADERFSGTLTVRYTGQQRDITFTDPTYATSPVVTLDDYWLVNLNAEVRLSPMISLTGRVENLLDEEYEEVFSFVAPGRSAFAGLRARF
jgi:vitamin B12 transporter